MVISVHEVGRSDYIPIEDDTHSTRDQTSVHVQVSLWKESHGAGNSPRVLEDES